MTVVSLLRHYLTLLTNLWPVCFRHRVRNDLDPEQGRIALEECSLEAAQAGCIFCGADRALGFDVVWEVSLITQVYHSPRSNGFKMAVTLSLQTEIQHLHTIFSLYPRSTSVRRKQIEATLGSKPRAHYHDA